MATVRQIPDQLSFLRNLKSFVFNTSSEVSFVLKKGEEVLIDETYYPDDQDQVSIDVNEVIGHFLHSDVPTADVFSQTSAAADFEAILDGVQIAFFRVLLGGMRKMAVTTEAFLKANWLTWQPQVKNVGWNSPEFLSYYFTEAASVKCQFYPLDGSKEVITLADGIPATMVTFNVSLAHLFSKSAHKVSELSGYVDLYVENPAGTRLSYIQRFFCGTVAKNSYTYLCVNSLGGIDTFTFTGSRTMENSGEYEVATRADQKISVGSGLEYSWKQDSGFLGKSASLWVTELLSSSAHWTVENGSVQKIVIDQNSTDFRSSNNLHSCSFHFFWAEDADIIDIARSPEAFPTVEFPAPEGDIFFLEARLVEYPDAELKNDLLFLVQSPYSSTWSKTSLGAIGAWLTDILNVSDIAIQSHAHLNKATLDKVSEDGGHMAFNLRKLAFEDDVEARYLHKDKPDAAAEKIAFLDGIELGRFTPGVAGTGGFVDAQGNAFLQSASLRGFLEAPEFRYNRISIEVGNKWNAPGAGIIEAAFPDLDAGGEALMTGTAVLHLEEGEIGKIAVDDICQGIFHDGMRLDNNADADFDDGSGNFLFSGFFTAYFCITEILDEKNTRFRYQLRGFSESWLQAHHPCMAMHFVCYGNFSDKSRQVSRYSTRTYERYLMGVNTWEFSSNNIAAQFGDLSNLKLFGLNMTGYSAYLNNIYMSGTIQQLQDLPLRLEIDMAGDNFMAWGEKKMISCELWRGYHENLTDQVLSWEIKRDSGNKLEDDAWNLKDKAKKFNGRIELSFTADENDLSTSPEAVSTIFTITASLQDAEPVKTIIEF